MTRIGADRGRCSDRACRQGEVHYLLAQACLDGFPEDGGVARPPVWVEGEAGDHTDSRPAETRVEALRVIAGHRVENQQGLTFRPSFRLGLLHEQLRDAALAGRAVDE